MAYKHDYDKALTRLRIILQRLNDGESLGVKELAEEFNVSTRTIQRDFNEKLVSSYPIYQENKKWKMQDGFKIEKIRDIDDKIILDILEKITDGIGGTFASKSKKLLSKIKNEDHNPIYAKLNIEDISDKISDVNIIEIAIKEKKEIQCNYTLENKDTYSTTLKPLKIVNYEGFWYLVALNNDEIKKYYLKDLTNIKMTKETFEVENKIDELLDNSISIWFNQYTEPFEVKLYANKWTSKYFKRRPLPMQSIVSLHEDGGMEFIIKITHEMEILPIVKYWIPHLHILEPKWIQDMLEEDIKEFSDF
ncbi:helix-turn-helix transcriptional regulator [Poseidonibacter sp.]|uniref:helix-turn-helix transcriptional regulator n=1 Tax=Poseidonibacter sp. TaxID=2321188 RepID=UPI003C71972C